MPNTARKLNSWIQEHFQVFEGPARAYFNLPFRASMGDPGREEYCEYNHHVAYITLGFLGTEEECCKAIAAHLYSSVSPESFLDASEPIFIRRWFDFLKDDSDSTKSSVVGRLAFWNTKINKNLIKTTCYHVEGSLLNKPVMPTDLV